MMRRMQHLSLMVGVAVAVSGCGGTEFGGLGEMDEGGFDSSGGEAIVELDGALEATADDAESGAPPAEAPATEAGDESDRGIDAGDEEIADQGVGVADGRDAMDAIDDAAQGEATVDATPEGSPLDAAADQWLDGSDASIDSLDALDPLDSQDATSEVQSRDSGPEVADPGTVFASVPGSVVCEGKVCTGRPCCGNFLVGWSWDCGGVVCERGYACDERSDCGGGQLCCTSKNVFGTINGSACHGGCGSELQLCSSSAECTDKAKSCKAYTPPDAKRTMGACQ